MSVHEQDVVEAFSELEIEKYKVSGQIKIEQYRSLRSELLDDLKAMHQVELYSIIGLAAFYAWAFSRCLPEVPINLPLIGSFGTRLGRLLPWIIPILIPLFGWWRNRIYALGVRRIATYLRLIEDELAKDAQPIGPHKGWETYVQSLRADRILEYRIPLGDPFRTFWVVISFMIICVAAVGAFVGNADCRLGHP